MQIGDVVRVVGYDNDDNGETVKVNGRTGTIVRISPISALIEVDLGFSSDNGLSNWLFFDDELEPV